MKDDERVELTASEAKDAIAALTGLTKLILELRTSCRSAHRQVEMFMRDGERERLTVALVELETALTKDVDAVGVLAGDAAREWSPGDGPVLAEVDPSSYLPGSEPLDPPRWVDGPRHCGDESCPGCNRVFGKIVRLDDHRPFDVGTPNRCYQCGTSDVVKHVGDGGFVWGCMSCGHPEDS